MYCHSILKGITALITSYSVERRFDVGAVSDIQLFQSELENFCLINLYLGCHIDFQQKLLETGAILDVKRLSLRCMPWLGAEFWVISDIVAAVAFILADILYLIKIMVD